MSLNLEQYAGNEFPVIDGGEYEVVLFISKKRTKDGTKEFANLDFMVRDDVEQKFKGAHVFDKAWPDLTSPQWFDLKKLGSILVTQKERPGYKTTFDEVDECIQYLNGINLIITVEKTYDEYYQKEVNGVKYLSYKPSKLGPYVKPVKESGAAPAPKAEGEGEIVANNVPDITKADFPF